MILHDLHGNPHTCNPKHGIMHDPIFDSCRLLEPGWCRGKHITEEERKKMNREANK